MAQSPYTPSSNLTFTTPGIALITGASSGVGKSGALALHNAGWICVLVARRSEQLKETLDLMEDTGKVKGGSSIITADLSKREDVVRVFDEIKGRYGKPDTDFPVRFKASDHHLLRST